MKISMKTLVTGSGGPAGLNALRFIPNDIPIVSCDSDIQAKTRMVRTGRETELYIVPPGGDPNFLDEIRKIVEKEKIKVIIPTVDEELLVLSKNMKKMLAKIILSPYRTVKICDDKALLYEKFRSSGISPRYLVTDKKEDLKAFFGDEKVFIKPRVGRGSRGAQLYDHINEIPLDKINKKNIFSEFMVGTEYTVDCLCDLEGKLVVAVPRQRISVEGGVSIYGKTEYSREILEKVEFICNTLKFIGPINIQFKRDLQEFPKLVEINPRLSGGLPITVASGVNPLDLLYKLLNKERIHPHHLKFQEKSSRHERI